jgi:hypothetical protein
MIKKYSQFIAEELSPELLKRAARSAYDRNQEVRGNKFGKAASDSEREEKNNIKKANYDAFMSLTGGVLFGYECVVDPLRVNPGGDTWIEIKGDFKTKKGSADRIFITDDLIKENKLCIIANGTEQNIDLKDLVVDRKDARVYSNFLNWWNGGDKPFSVDDYCIRGIHV